MPFHILLPIAILSAKIFEEIVQRIGFPAILGAILAGFVLGPLGFDLTPGLFGPQDSGQKIFSELAKIGLCVLLFRIGIETRFEQLKSVWQPAVIVALTGMFLPLFLGYFAAKVLGLTTIQSVFIGATLSATSIGITVPVLKELNAQTSKEGLIICGAAVLDDVLGLILLSVLIAVAQPELSTVWGAGGAIVLGVIFIGAGVLLGPWLVEGVLRILRRINNPQLILVFAFSYLLIMAQLAHDVGLDMIIGAYAAGLAFSQIQERELVETGLKPLTDLFAPLFFLLIGASIIMPELTYSTAAGQKNLLFLGVLLIVAFVGKLFCGFGAKKEGTNIWAIGCGMLPRGEVGLVFAQVGLAAGIFSKDVFSLLVLLLLVTTCVGPLMLKAVWRQKVS